MAAETQRKPADAPSSETHPPIHGIDDVLSYLARIRGALAACAAALEDGSEDTSGVLERIQTLYRRFGEYHIHIIKDAEANRHISRHWTTIDLVVKGIQDSFEYNLLKYRMKPAEDSEKDEKPSSVVNSVQTFGSILKGYRKAARLSQQELADLADMTRPNVTQLESDKWDPRLSTILKLADALQVEPSALLPPRPGRQR